MAVWEFGKVLEVISAVRERVGDDFVVGCRYLADECIEGGNSVDEAELIGTAFAKAGLDVDLRLPGGRERHAAPEILAHLGAADVEALLRDELALEREHGASATLPDDLLAATAGTYAPIGRP